MVALSISYIITGYNSEVEVSPWKVINHDVRLATLKLLYILNENKMIYLLCCLDNTYVYPLPNTPLPSFHPLLFLLPIPIPYPFLTLPFYLPTSNG